MAVDYAALKKGGFMHQKQNNHFSLRLSVVGGQITVKQLAAIAEVAEKYGHGYIHLTSRQGIEIPFIRLEDIEKVKEELAKGDAKPGVSGPRVRTVTACQGSAVCRNGCVETEELARELDARYYGRDLPHKFKFGITGCPNNCLKVEANDLGIKGGVKVSWKAEDCIFCGACESTCKKQAIYAENDRIVIDPEKCSCCGKCAAACPAEALQTVPGYTLYFGGVFGNTIDLGTPIIPFVEDRETLFNVCDAALDFFRDNAKKGERFKFTIDRVGRDKLEEAVRGALKAE